MAFKAGEVDRNLPAKGFVRERDGHHIYFRFYYKGRKTSLYTYISHGKSREDVGDDNVRAMKMQLGLGTLGQVRQLIECTMNEQQYIAELKALGKLRE